ncbi:alpha/beta fold hydrolase [Jannaschia donghaensis]|uniref:Dihydrolipoyllysine-residue acetyltransferase component of acetoin cleaving system n=1 Tax=Jannaschia donghaensis TaxID=420998 RepID=A0A0M6YNW3_9RHOB|nr:alpha/beta hydrolase [Jannaschia donghaensis]CTQ50937.1 Dihydrolipoyllysine-residue acetyltransferase component of acetoin cleaving system [Jannaschia donghaensis]
MRRAFLTGAPLLGLTALGGSVLRGRAAAREAEFEAAFPPQGEILDVDGVPVHAVVRGTGPDLVMLHGASGNSREFTFAMMDRLSDRYRCIAFDRPGLGYTGHTDPKYASAFSSDAESPAEQAALLSRAHAQIGEGPPIVLGHSFGGTIALAWGLDHPARALVLLAAPSNEWPGGLGALYAVNSSAPGGAFAVPLLTATVSEDRLRAITENIFAPDPMPDGYFEHLGGQLTLRRDSLRSNARQVNGLKPHILEMEKRYATLTLPIEMVHGTADTIVPADIHAKVLIDMVPDGNLTLLIGVGHMPHHADPDAVIAAIDRAADRAA